MTVKGIEPDPEHLQAINQAPTPKDPTSLSSFLGMLSWHQKFIPDYATVVEPLRAWLRQEPFEWTEQAQTCFVTVKDLLLHSPALALFNPGFYASSRPTPPTTAWVLCSLSCTQSTRSAQLRLLLGP